MFVRIFISIIFYFISYLISFKLSNSNKIRRFESGFRSVGSLTRRFSIHFFILVLIFVIFELEVVLLLTVLYRLRINQFVLIILFILGGIYLEYSIGKLRWMV